MKTITQQDVELLWTALEGESFELHTFTSNLWNYYPSPSSEEESGRDIFTRLCICDQQQPDGLRNYLALKVCFLLLILAAEGELE